MQDDRSAMTNTIVLITGSNTGLGLATVQALLSNPIKTKYTVILTSRSHERSMTAVETVGKDETFEPAFSAGSELVPMQLDLDDERSVESIRKEVEEKFGRLDVLVNNAGEPKVLVE